MWGKAWSPAIPRRRNFWFGTSQGWWNGVKKNGLDVVLADAMYDVLNMDLSGVEQVDLPE